MSDEKNGDELFEDLDKFFAPIRDVDWDEPEEPAAVTPSEEHVWVRTEEPPMAELPGTEPGARGWRSPGGPSRNPSPSPCPRPRPPPMATRRGTTPGSSIRSTRS